MLKWLRRSCLAALVGAALALAATHSIPAIAQSSAGQKGEAIAWNDSFKAAQKTAVQKKKVLFLDFGATWCGPCQEMLHTTYKDSAIVAHSKSFVPVLVDVDKSADLAKKYNVDAIPVVLFLSPRGKVLARSVGYLQPQQLLKLMDEAQKKAKS
jgi:thiol:disulfide interchange protein